MDAKPPTIGLLADPGAPEALAAKIADVLSDRISRDLDQRWEVEVSAETLPLSPEGTIQLAEHAPELMRRHEWDCLVYLSDLPRYVDDHPMIGEVSPDTHAALVAVPVLGAFRVGDRAQDLVLDLIRVMRRSESQDEEAIASVLGRSDVSAHLVSEPTDMVRLVLTGRRRRPQVLAGMVRSNRPGRLLSALTGCMAAAVAAGAFGIFYGSLAPVAEAQAPWRLALISLLVVGVLTTWLIIRNGLWNVERGSDMIWQRGLDNASTVITVGLSVLMLYVGLVAAMIVLAFVVLAPSYLRGGLLHAVGAPEYLKLALLSAAMGIMAGALGANFDQEDSVREATFSRRYNERRKLFDAQQRRESEQE